MRFRLDDSPQPLNNSAVLHVEMVTPAHAQNEQVKQTQAPLRELIRLYGVRLDAAAQASRETLPSALIATLRTRDGIARHLESEACDAIDDIAELSRLDDRFRSLAPQVEAAMGVEALKKLRSATAGKSQGWWWKLDEHLPGAWWIWTALTALLFTAAVSLITEIARRFFAEGPDILGALYTLVQAGLALVAGSTLVGAGGRGLERALDSKGIRRRWHARIKTAFAAVIMCVALGGVLLLPKVAIAYMAAGVSRALEGNFSRAIQDFKRALSLTPDFSEAHYNLGRAYEAVLEYDDAAKEYQKAFQIERAFYPAYNSLARLYLVQNKDASNALGLIDQALDLTAVDTIRPKDQVARARFALFKNRGWANLQNGNYAQARVDLAEAQDLASKGASSGASPHCLLAQINEKQRIAAAEEWYLCLRYSSGASDVEPIWRSMAQDRLTAREVGK